MKKSLNSFFVSIASLLAITAVNSDAYASGERMSINDGWKFRIGADTASTAVHLPHSWNSDAYTTRNYYRGDGTYTRRLTIPEKFNGKQIYLRLDGAASKSEISIDGRHAGKHIGAYSSHTLDITPFVTPGKTHTLTVKVNNSDASIPPYSADFTFMGGLYRDAWLIAVPQLHFDIATGTENGFRVTTRPGKNGTWDVDVTGLMVNDTDRKEKPSVTVRLYAPDGKIIAEKKQQLTVSPGSASPFGVNLTGISDVELWSPEHPSLYRVEASVTSGGETIDTSDCHTGFRTFGFDNEGKFLLNGSPYKLRGMCRHQDMAPMGIALTDEQHRRDMQLIKEMGANFIRISHSPQDDAVLEMCDRLGLIAWEEVPVIDYVPESEEFADNAETMLREMVRRHYNHPSVAMWGYMNEILLRMPRENQEQTKLRTRQLAERLEKVLREEDSTRLSTMAFHGSDVYHGAGLGEITDVKGWNLYQGWYGGKLPEFEAYLSRQHREHPSHRLIVSEYGAGSDLRLHSLAPEPFDFSMEYQQEYLEHYLPVIEDSAFIAGASHWNFIDFSSANRAESMPHINNKGIVTNDRRKKDVYYYYKAMWHDTPDTVAHIATRDWSDRTEIIGEEGYVTRPVKVYTNLPAVTLSLNGMSLGSATTSNRTALFEAPLRPGTNVIELSTPDSPGNIIDATVINLNAITAHEGIIDPGTAELAINVGSGCYFRSDDSGLTWLPDREYTPGSGYGHIGGKRAVSQDEILLTDDEPLLQHCLSGIEEYHVDVVPGRYEVELSFAELAAPSAMSAYMLGHNAGTNGNGVTEMDIELNGKKIETGFAPAKSSGAKAMVKRRYITEATPGSGITVKFTPAEGTMTSLSAIKVRKL